MEEVTLFVPKQRFKFARRSDERGCFTPIHDSDLNFNVRGQTECAVSVALALAFALL